MSDPRLEIEKRVDNLEAAVKALVQRTGREVDIEHIEKILRGENVEEPNENAGT